MKVELKRKKEIARKTSMKEKGITLIALIVTIIILLILAGVTINMAVNDKGIFSKARIATSAYKMAGAREKIETLMSEYAMEKATNDSIALKDYLAGKEGIGDITDNGDGTLSVVVEDVYLFKIKDDGTGVIDTETLKGIVPQVIYSIYSDNVGKTEIKDISITSDNVYIGVKVTNKEDYTSTPITELKDPNGITITSMNVSEFDGYYEITRNGNYTLKVKGTNNDGTRIKIQTIKISNFLQVLPGTKQTTRDTMKKISMENLVYADLDGNPETAEGIIVADTKGNAVTVKNSVDENLYDIKDYVGESKIAKGKIISKKLETTSFNYYVLALADYDESGHSWYNNAYGRIEESATSDDFGKGKQNTVDMRKKTNWGLEENDVWNIFTNKKFDKWFIPSKNELSIFVKNLKIQGMTLGKTGNYNSELSFNNWYWSSSLHNSYSAWGIGVDDGTNSTQQLSQSSHR